MVEFDTERHREFITRRGEPVQWYRGAACPCADPLAGTNDRSCELCGGSGTIWTLQDTGDYRALVRQVEERKLYERYGQIVTGDITITTMPDEIPIAEGDKVGLPDRAFRHEEVLLASGADTDALKWIPAASLVSVRDAEQEYEVGVDVALTSGGGSLNWLATPPLVGTRISAVYWWTPQYLVLPGMTMSRRVIDGVSMPQRILARLHNPSTGGS